MSLWNHAFAKSSVVGLLCYDHELFDCIDDLPYERDGYIYHRYRMHQNGSCVGYVSDDIVEELISEGKIKLCPGAHINKKFILCPAALFDIIDGLEAGKGAEG